MSSFHSIAIAGLAAVMLAAPASAGVKEGIDAWQRGDYAAAAADWKKDALKGDADAQFNLGQAYRYGRGVPLDPKLALSWFNKAALQGHPGAGANLGLMMFQNGDRAGAMPWLRKAADRGEPRAQYIVGTAAFNGDLSPKDWPHAYAYMTRAAAAGLPQASASLATMASYIPADQREQGIALAAEMERQEAAARMPTRVAVDTGISSFSLPPSQPARVAQAAPQPPAPAGAAPKTSASPVAAAKPGTVASTKPIAAKPAKSDTPAVTAEPKPVTPPKPAPVKVAAPKPAPVQTAVMPRASGGGGWRIQLGAFANPDTAGKLWARLSTRPGLTGLQSFVTKAGPVNRLQAGPFATRAAAANACQAAKAAGSACFTVAP